MNATTPTTRPAPVCRSSSRFARNVGRAALAGVIAICGAALPSQAGPIASGPTLVGGWSGDDDASGASQDLGILALGWRWRFDGADAIDDFLAKAKIDFSWAVEPLAGVVFGDAEAFEASVVPYVHLRPLGWDGVVPYFEGGVGLAYTGLRNYGLGSRVTFSDDVGLGVAFADDAGRSWSIGYRFRHLSHAGIFGSPNDGLNSHFLTISVER